MLLGISRTNVWTMKSHSEQIASRKRRVFRAVFAASGAAIVCLITVFEGDDTPQGLFVSLGDSE